MHLRTVSWSCHDHELRWFQSPPFLALLISITFRIPSYFHHVNPMNSYYYFHFAIFIPKTTPLYNYSFSLRQNSFHFSREGSFNRSFFSSSQEYLFQRIFLLSFYLTIYEECQGFFSSNLLQPLQHCEAGHQVAAHYSHLRQVPSVILWVIYEYLAKLGNMVSDESNQRQIHEGSHSMAIFLLRPLISSAEKAVD